MLYGQKIRAIRCVQSLSQQSLADKVGVNYRTIYLAEQAKGVDDVTRRLRRGIEGAFGFFILAPQITAALAALQNSPNWPALFRAALDEVER